MVTAELEDEKKARVRATELPSRTSLRDRLKKALGFTFAPARRGERSLGGEQLFRTYAPTRQERTLITFVLSELR